MCTFFDDNIFSHSPFGEKLNGKFENQPHCTHCKLIFYRNVPSTIVFLFKRVEVPVSCHHFTFFKAQAPHHLCTFHSKALISKEASFHSSSILLIDILWDSSWKTVKDIVRNRRFRGPLPIQICLTFCEELTWQYPASQYFKSSRVSLYQWSRSLVLQTMSNVRFPC